MEFVKDRPLHLAKRELQAMLTSPPTLTLMAAATVLLALSGPFGTYAGLALPERVLYWLAIVVFGYGLGRLTAHVALHTFAPHIANPFLRTLLASLVASLPAWLVVLAVESVAHGDVDRVDPLRLWLSCLVIALTISTAIMVNRRPPALKTLETTPPDRSLPPLLERLPHPMRGRLLHIAVGDHYVDVTTDKGNSLVLMRLSDAIRETVPEQGLQVHRSHWVALAAVRKGARQGGKPALELKNGTVVPVSRTFMQAVKAAGLLP